MAFTPYHNLDGSVATENELVAPGTNANEIKSILITNTHNTDAATVGLYISKLSIEAIGDAAENYYLLKKVKLPLGSSLLLDSDDMLGFDNSENAFGLYMTVGSGDTVDVLIKR